MKKLLLSSVVFFLINKTQAQVVFCPSGAEWNYIFSSGFDPQKTNEKIKYTHDSIVDGMSVKVLSHKLFFSSYAEYGGPTLIRQISDTVFMRNARTQHTWQVLYNYSALPGHSWYNSIVVGPQTNSAIVNYTITVDSVSQIVDNGFNLKRLYVRYSSSYGNGGTYYKGPITERYGCDEFMFNFTNRVWSDGDFVTAFLCYSDVSFGVKQFTALDCNYSNLVGLGDQQAFLSDFKVYPNPVSDFLTIEINGVNLMNFELNISDLQGREIKRLTIEENDKIDLSDLSRGFFVLTLTKDKELIYTTKIVKVD